MAERIIDPYRLWSEWAEEKSVHSDEDVKCHASYFRALERLGNRFANNVRRLAAEDTAHVVHICPYQVAGPYLERSQFLRYRLVVVRHVCDISAREGVKAVAGLFSPAYFPQYGVWLAMARVLVIGHCQTDDLRQAVGRGHRTDV